MWHPPWWWWRWRLMNWYRAECVVLFLKNFPSEYCSLCQHPKDTLLFVCLLKAFPSFSPGANPFPQHGDEKQATCLDDILNVSWLAEITAEPHLPYLQLFIGQLPLKCILQTKWTVHFTLDFVPYGCIHVPIWKGANVTVTIKNRQKHKWTNCLLRALWPAGAPKSIWFLLVSLFTFDGKLIILMICCHAKNLHQVQYDTL